MLGDDPLVNEEAGNVELVQEEAFSIDGFIARDITKQELADTLLSKVSSLWLYSQNFS